MRVPNCMLLILFQLTSFQTLVALEGNLPAPRKGSDGKLKAASSNKQLGLNLKALHRLEYATSASNVQKGFKYLKGVQGNFNVLNATSCSILSMTSIDNFGRLLNELYYNKKTKLLTDVTWNGIYSSDWNDQRNWSGSLPTTATNVVIPNTSNFPVLSAVNGSAQDITILAGATLKITGAKLSISGTINNFGSLDATEGTLDFNGTIGQTITGKSFLANTIKNLTISNPQGLTVSSLAEDSINITGELAFGNVNNATLYTGNNIVLRSTAFHTANIADVTNKGINTGNKFNGSVIVERFFQPIRAYRLFTAPVSAGGSVFDNWQNGGVYQAGKGTAVTGTGAISPTGANGLDWSTQNNVSLKVGVGATFVNILNTNTALLSKNVADTSDNLPYFIFVRGDRNPVNFNVGYSNYTTLRSKGKLQANRQTFPVAATATTFTIVGNPYASPVDLAKIERNNIVNRYSLWDPYTGATGAYITFDDILNTGTYQLTPPSPGLTQILQSGQAFYAQTAINGPASVAFQESSKSSANNLLTFRPKNQVVSFRANLYHVNTDNNMQLLDGIMVQFDDSYSKEVDLLDALKLTNVNENLGIERDSKTLVIERRPIPNDLDTVFLQLTETTQRGYRLEFQPSNYDAGFTAFLRDSYLGKTIPLDLNTNSNYDFKITTDTASAVPGRFMIIIRKAIVVPPIAYKNFSATQQGDNVSLNWTIENETNIKNFEVEKSADGISFTKINQNILPGGNLISVSHTFLDKNPIKGKNFYQILSIEKEGKTTSSNIALVTIDHLTTGVRICPNPVINGIIRTEFKNMVTGRYSIKLVSGNGQTVLKKNINHVSGNTIENIYPPFKLMKGVYKLECTAPDNTRTITSVIVE